MINIQIASIFTRTPLFGTMRIAERQTTSSARSFSPHLPSLSLQPSPNKVTVPGVLPNTETTAT